MPLVQTLPRSNFWYVHVLVQKRLRKDPSTPKCDLMQTLACSIYEKIQIDQKSSCSSFYWLRYEKTQANQKKYNTDFVSIVIKIKTDVSSKISS